MHAVQTADSRPVGFCSKVLVAHSPTQMHDPSLVSPAKEHGARVSQRLSSHPSCKDFDGRVRMLFN